MKAGGFVAFFSPKKSVTMIGFVRILRYLKTGAGDVGILYCVCVRGVSFRCMLFILFF